MFDVDAGFDEAMNVNQCSINRSGSTYNWLQQLLSVRQAVLLRCQDDHPMSQQHFRD